MPQIASPWENENRFDVREKLGSGGMGVVYLVLDRELDSEVALKVLTEISGNRLVRFKNEFRFLTELVHPNLVTLYDLFSEGDEWYFTMEYIAGHGFLDYVRPIGATKKNIEESPSTFGDSIDHQAAQKGLLDLIGSKTHLRMQATVYCDRLRNAFIQLVKGIDAIHQMGLLHRDIKPSNVLVQADGRVAVCDFGLVSQRKTSSDSSTQTFATVSEKIIGTPVYMAPEQVGADASLTVACDWYSVGVMLYEALCGLRPHQGGKRDVFSLKKEVAPPQPKERSRSVPEDLNDLCMALLDIDPGKRPSAKQLLDELVHDSYSSFPTHLVHTEQKFIGRVEELSVLHQAYAQSQQGSCVTQFVIGKSGTGKTTLVQKFLDEIRETNQSVILCGKCYERESVPYKTLDPIIDNLSQILQNLDRNEIEDYLPRDIASLARLFPSLTSVDFFSVQGSLPTSLSDPQEMRKRAFGALRYMLRQIANKRHLVIHSDDLQWGDLDSAYFLRDLIHHGESLPLLLIYSVREEEMESSPLIHTLLQPDESGVSESQIRRLALLPLDGPDSTALARSLLGGSSEQDDWAASIAKESGGNPLFIHELVRAKHVLSKADAPKRLNHLQELILARFHNLPKNAMDLLSTIVVAGHRIPVGVVVKACPVENAALGLAHLRHERFIRVLHSSHSQVVETFHDWIHRSIMSTLTQDQLQQTHAKLAQAFEVERYRDTVALVEHWSGAREHQRSGRYALESAKNAESSAAFRQAAEFYQIALERLDLNHKERSEILKQMGEALQHAGSLRQAGQAFLEAAEGDQDVEGTKLRKQALECMLISGNLEKGLALAHQVMQEVGLRMPRTTVGGILSFLARRSVLGIRGYGYKPTQKSQLIEHLRIDVELAASLGLTFVSPILATVLQQRLMFRALKVGDPARIVHSRALEIGYRSMAGAKTTASVERFAKETLELAKKKTNPATVGIVLGMSGLACYLRGQFRLGLERLNQGIELMLDHNPSELTYYIDGAKNYRMAVWLYLGEMRQLRNMVPIELREAIERGDTYFANTLRSWRSNLAWLVMDKPEEALRQLAEVSQATLAKKFHLHHYYELLSEVQIYLYKKDVDKAWKLIEQKWPKLASSMVLRIQSIRIESFYLWSRVALAQAVARPESKESLVGQLRKKIRKVRKENVAWGEGLALLIRGLTAQVEGQLERAIRDLSQAEQVCTQADMAIHAAVCKHRRGLLIGGEEGARLIHEATHLMESQDVENQQAFTYLYAPLPESETGLE